MNGLRITPSKVPVHVFLSCLISEVLLSPYNMRYTHQMIVNPAGKVVERPNPILASHPRMGMPLRIDDSESGPISNCRVGVVQISFDPHHCLTFPICTVQHAPPPSNLLFRCKMSTRARLIGFHFIPKLLTWADANVGMVLLEKLLNVFVIDRESVALNDLSIPITPKPSEVLSYEVVEWQSRLFQPWIGVLKSEIEEAVIHFGVLVTEDDGSG